MQRLSVELAELGRELLRAFLVAALIFQGVLGSAHLAFAAAAPDGSPAPVICSVDGAAPLKDSGGTPDEPGTPGTLACPVCASSHHIAGTFVPQLASIPRPTSDTRRLSRLQRDQWPEDRQPHLANSRAPPRS